MDNTDDEKLLPWGFLVDKVDQDCKNTKQEIIDVIE